MSLPACIILNRKIPVLLSKDEYDIIKKIFPTVSILMNLSCIYNKKYLIFREVSTMPINKNELTKEMIAKAMQCRTVDELVALAKAEGFEITKIFRVEEINRFQV